jgi:hypothetical protein
MLWKMWCCHVCCPYGNDILVTFTTLLKNSIPGKCFHVSSKARKAYSCTIMYTSDSVALNCDGSMSYESTGYQRTAGDRSLPSLYNRLRSLALHSVLETNRALPQLAWRLNTPPIMYAPEPLVDVEALRIGAASFSQTCERTSQHL